MRLPHSIWRHYDLERYLYYFSGITTGHCGLSWISGIKRPTICNLVQALSPHIRTSRSPIFELAFKAIGREILDRLPKSVKQGQTCIIENMVPQLIFKTFILIKKDYSPFLRYNTSNSKIRLQNRALFPIIVRSCNFKKALFGAPFQS